MSALQDRAEAAADGYCGKHYDHLDNIERSAWHHFIKGYLAGTSGSEETLPDTPFDGVEWGIEHSCNTLWIGPMRPDGEKVDQVVVSLACGPEFTHNQQVRQHQYANLIAAAPNLLVLLEELYLSFDNDKGSDLLGRVREGLIAAGGLQ